MERIECQWCRLQNEPGARSCLTCGAPLDVKNVVSDSGWREAPRLRDMTEFRFANSTVQVEGELVPAGRRLRPGRAGLDLLRPPRAALDRAGLATRDSPAAARGG